LRADRRELIGTSRVRRLSSAWSPATLGDQQTIRRIRLACGWVLFTCVSLHLLNRALGNVSWQAMERGARAAEWIWRSLPGTVGLSRPC
jgi:hypothetical protein